MARAGDGQPGDPGRATPARGARTCAIVAALAALIVVLPVVGQFVDGRRGGAPEAHPSFDGEVYVLPREGSTGPAHSVGARIDAAIAVLLDESVAVRDGRPDAPVAGLDTVGPSSGDVSRVGTVESRLEDRLATHGLTGSWRKASTLDVQRLLPPFLAPVETGRGPSVVLVRRLHAGFVYGFEPTRGDVLYPSREFERAWTGRVRTFDPPLELDAFWQ